MNALQERMQQMIRGLPSAVIQKSPDLVVYYQALLNGTPSGPGIPSMLTAAGGVLEVFQDILVPFFALMKDERYCRTDPKEFMKICIHAFIDPSHPSSSSNGWQASRRLAK